MSGSPLRTILVAAAAVFCCGWPCRVSAGGSGFNVAVVVNQASPGSLALGNYYCERRSIPPENVVRINWTGGNTTWTRSDFESLLLDPLLAAIAQRQLTNQIRYVVLSMDIPFAVSENGKVNSTSSSLFYGFKSDSKSNQNSYAHSESAFGELLPDTAPGFSFLTTMITAGSLAQAMQLVDQGVNSDSAFPTQQVILARSSDPLRNQRYTLFDQAIFNTQLAGYGTMRRIDSDVVSGRSDLLGFQTGLGSFTISPNTFIPGAMADSMTSYGGVIFGPNSQTTLLAFIHAGAAGSYGTVAEPGASISKFPDPLVYFYQARGFSLAECYYQGIEFPYQGLIVGEPLAAPYQHPANGAWIGINSNAVLSDTAQLTVEFAAAASTRPLQQVDLFVDGKYFQTLTNITPQAGNELSLNFVGGTVHHTVPPDATLTSLASELASSINIVAAATPANITATAIGDRIEVRSLSGNRPRSPGATVVLSSPPSEPPPSAGPPTLTGSSAGTAGSLTTFLTAARESSSLESSATGMRACALSGPPEVGSWLRLEVTKTNGAVITVAATNQSTGIDLADFASQLADLVNTTPALQDTDGLGMRDVAGPASTVATFNLQPRSAGYAAAGMRFHLIPSPGLAALITNGDLRQNLHDLLPRNHIYVRAGAMRLTIRFPFDTTKWPDGHHELTAVAYEGSSVRTQTRASLPVRTQNTSLNATLTIPGLPDPAPAEGTYSVEVIANQGGVAAIRLFSTGGSLDSVSGQSSATFTLDGSTLGAGLHPVWAEVETTGGAGYRTDTLWIRLGANP